MPDVVIVGGGIIGCACAYELARSGASVTLLERSELAAGASGRNQGLYTTPLDPALAQMARASLAAYLELAEETPTPAMLDREPCGWLAVAGDDEEAALAREEAEAAAALGVAVEHLDVQAAHELEPELATGLEGWLLDDGYRLDPAALTVALAHLANRHGATVRHHLPARRLVVRADRVTGVLTDDGVVEADTVVLAAGPWTPGLLETLVLHLPVFGLRGWLIRLRPAAPLFSRILETAGRVLRHEPARPPSAAEVAEGNLPASVGGLLH
ncbi:MAG: NAD(P)/FAD-dependent oxidoreductase, partial [Actinomycetota bacterium]